MNKAVNLNIINKKKPKKRYFVVPLSFILIFLIIFKLNFDTIIFNVGKNAYDNKNYQKALNTFEILERKDQNNKNYSYYKILTISKMPMTYTNQTKLLQVVNSNRAIKGKNIAINTINKFRINIKRAYGKNYISDAIPGGDVVRWNLSDLPITYFLQDDGATPSNYINIVENSFQQWQRASNNLITFSRTNNKDKANIIISFIDRPQSDYKTNLSQEYNVGLASPVIENNKLCQMKIELLKKNNLGGYFTPRAFSTVVLHEIGHSLGIWGHSINRNNIMFYSADRDMGTYQVFISQEDINTLKLLYSLKPDITNIKMTSQEINNLINPNLIIGDSINSDDKINSCINFLNKRPDDLNRWLNLAEAYHDNQQFDMAINTLTKVLNMNPDDELKYIIYYDLAINYIGLEEYDNAMISAIHAKDITDDLDIKILVSEIYIQQKKYKYAEVTLEELMATYPANIDVASTLAETYIKQGKYFKARKVLKEIISRNPNAKDDETIKKYSVYTIF